MIPFDPREPVCLGHVHFYPLPGGKPGELYCAVVHDKHCPEWCR